MPRQKNAISPELTGPVPDFARELRALRDRAGRPTYDAMATEGYFSKSTLSNADNGVRLPTWDVTKAYVSACGGNVVDWKQRWNKTADEIGYRRKAQAQGQHALSEARLRARAPLPDPSRAATTAEFRNLLGTVRERVSDLSYDSIAKIARLQGFDLARSTVYDMISLKKNSLPKEDKLTAFLTVCDVPQAVHKVWTDACRRIRESEPTAGTQQEAVPDGTSRSAPSMEAIALGAVLHPTQGALAVAAIAGPSAPPTGPTVEATPARAALPPRQAPAQPPLNTDHKVLPSDDTGHESWLSELRNPSPAHVVLDDDIHIYPVRISRGYKGDHRHARAAARRAAASAGATAGRNRKGQAEADCSSGPRSGLGPISK